MNDRPNVLVVCGRNKKRSRTAENIFKNDSRFNIRSAGLSARSNRQISSKDVFWADLIFVMENKHAARILDQFRDLGLPSIENLHIDDDYEYLDKHLIEMLTERINSTLEVVFEI